MFSVAGHLPKPADGPMHTGKVGRDVTTEDAYKSARLVAINIIATLKCALKAKNQAVCTC